MCRPPCCDNSRGQGTGIVADGFILAAALIAAKVGPIMAKIMDILLEVIHIAALAAGAVLALAVVTWLTVIIVRWWLRHRGTHRRMALMPVVAREHIEPAHDRRGCLACGGSGQVLRAIGGSRYQPGE